MGGSVFALIMSLWLIIVAVWAARRSSRESKLVDRMNTGSTQLLGSPRTMRLWHDGKVATVDIGIEKRHTSPWAKLKRIHNELGLDMPLTSIILGVLGLSFMTGLIVFLVSNNVFLALSGSGAIVVGVIIAAQMKISQKEQLFERQLADALELAARSLRAGHPVMGAFQLVVDEMKPPISDMFADILQQQALGNSMENAISAKAEESSSSDMKLFAASMAIQLRSGGNLAQMMNKSAGVLRDRLKLHRKARVLTTETQFSKRILIGMPFFLFLLLTIVNPAYISNLYNTTVGRILLVVCGVMLIIGSWIMNKMAVLKY
jgi:tight adherence protein B